jgi:HlyD family secretion protein
LKKFFFILVLCLIGYGYYWYFAPVNGEEEVEAAPLKTHIAHAGELKVFVTATGTVRPHVEVAVKSKAGGEIVSFPFNEGGRVEKGAIIVRLDTETETSGVNQARAGMNIAEGKLERARIILKDTGLRLGRQAKLFEKGVISRQALDDVMIADEKAESEIKIAEAELLKDREALKEAEDRLADTEIRAPLTGTILNKYVEEGQVISSTLSSASEGTLLFTMADLNRLYVEAMVDEVDVGRVKTGQKVSITVDTWPDRVFEGSVERIAPKGRLERTVTVFDVVIVIAGTRSGVLRPGMSANVDIVTDHVKGALLVPSGSLRTRGEETGVYVYVPGGDGGGARGGEGAEGEEGAGPLWVEVSTGKTDGILTVITSGLEPGDEVVLSGVDKAVTGGSINDKKDKSRFLLYKSRRKK